MQTTANDTISIETQINAPVERVWRAWTESALVLRWFGSDPKGWGIYAKMDVKAGGHFEIMFANADGGQHTCSGMYAVVEQYRQLSFSWEWKNEPGVVSNVTVLLHPKHNATFMLFTHANVGTASAHDYLRGWKATFVKLERVVRG